jgi:hypothetical protein
MLTIEYFLLMEIFGGIIFWVVAFQQNSFESSLCSPPPSMVASSPLRTCFNYW